MAEQIFRVTNAPGMWLRSAPVVSAETEIVLLPAGQMVKKLGDSERPDWWRISTTFRGEELEGFSKRTLMSPDGESGPARGPVPELMGRTMAALGRVAPRARANYLRAMREGGPLFERHGITTPRRMAHFLAQVMQETGRLTVLRESMSYSEDRIMVIFGVGEHSARVTREEAARLARNEHALAERVYGLGNPTKARELGNTQPGDGFRYRGNGVLQMTGRGAHRRRGRANGLDFEGNPDLATLPEHALKPALQEWSDGNLNPAADRDDIVRITKVINGGDNGLPERRVFFARLLPLLDD